MIKNKNLGFIIVSLFVCITLGFCLELFFNRKVLLINDSYQTNILQMKNIVKEKEWYKTTKKNAYIIIETKGDFINKISFDYSSNKDFLWDLEYNGETISNTSSLLINQSIRKITRNINDHKIKISFYDKDIKIKNISINNKIYIHWNRFIVLVVMFFGIIILVKYRDYFFQHLEKTFLLIILTSGIVMMNVVPKQFMSLGMIKFI